MKRVRLSYLAIPFLASLSGFAAASSSAAEQPMLSREVILETDADPWAMASTGDDEGSTATIIAGNSGRAAWGAKFDGQGKMAWDYTMGLQDQFAYPVPYAQFRGAVSMPDGSAFLCGNMPRPPGSTASWLVLVHLDINGHPLSETFPTPDSHANPGVAARGASACVRSNDGVIVLAEASRVIRSVEKDVRPKFERFYWVFATDPAGRIKWETQIPMMLFNGFFQPGIILTATDAGVIFSATNNLSTELATISDSGVVKFHREIPGRFILVRAQVDGRIQLFGTANNQLRSAIVALDDRLAEVSRIEGDYPRNFLANFAYNAQGESIVLFGSTVHDSGANYTSLVVSVDRSLQAGRNFELPYARGPFKDIGFIRAAAPCGGADKFVVARSVLAVGSDDLTEAARPKMKRGLALDYLHFE
jgi:hypothetical protein